MSNFSFSQSVFQKACFPGASKGVIVWEWVNDKWNSWINLYDNSYGIPYYRDALNPFCYSFAIFLFSIQLFSKRQILDSSKLKELADDNSKFDENDVKFSKRLDNTVGKRRNCSFFHSVSKRYVLQTRKSQVLFGKGLIVSFFITLFSGTRDRVAICFFLPDYLQCPQAPDTAAQYSYLSKGQ